MVYQGSGSMADVKTTERYTHVMDKDISRISSPLEDLDL